MTKVVYRWNVHPGFDFKGDPQVVGEHLEGLAANTGGVTPTVVVEDARKPESPLHESFEWDDNTAAESWREHTARQLLGALVVVKVNERQVTGTVRAFVSVRNGNRSGTYQPIVAVMEDAELRKQLMNRARSELVQWRNRYSDLQEFSKVFKVVDELLPVLQVAA